MQSVTVSRETFPRSPVTAETSHSQPCLAHEWADDGWPGPTDLRATHSDMVQRCYEIVIKSDYWLVIITKRTKCTFVYSEVVKSPFGHLTGWPGWEGVPNHLRSIKKYTLFKANFWVKCPSENKVSISSLVSCMDVKAGIVHPVPTGED